MPRIQLAITGYVQGVGFRFLAHEKAEELCLTLHRAENMPDGRVVFEVEGSNGALEKFTEWAKRGPSFARIESVGVQRLPD